MLWIIGILVFIVATVVFIIGIKEYKMKYPTAFCKICDKEIFKNDGKVDKKGMWTCTDCLIKQDKDN